LLLGLGLSEGLGISALGAWKPLDMLLTLAPQVRDTLATQERKVSSYTGLYRAAREVSELLPILLTVQDGIPERSGVKSLGDFRQVLKNQRHKHYATFTAVEA
jgi:hypothetical protein